MQIATRTAPHLVAQFPGLTPRWRESLVLILAHLPFSRRTVHAGTRVQAAGDPFHCLQILNVGTIKTVNLAASGRAQIVGLHFKGDWIGFDGIALGTYACDAYAMEACEVWSLSYAGILEVARQVPEIIHVLHTAMGYELARHRNWKFALGTLAADGRVADFLRFWAQSLEDRDLRTDQLSLPMTRADIGSYLGLTLESVSRALTKLDRVGLIQFEHHGRRNIAIPSLAALGEYIDRSHCRAELQPVHALQ